MCHFVLVYFSPFSIAITSLGEERANLSAFRTSAICACLGLSVSSSSWGLGTAAVCDCGTLVWICRFPLPLGVWEGLRFVIVALPGLFSYLFLLYASITHYNRLKHIIFVSGKC